MARSTAFYSVSDASFFVGTVALLNSLRLTGHVDPLVVLDCGFTPEQRAQLEPAATVITAPEGQPSALAKWVAPLERPAETMVLIDSDIVVVTSLAPLLQLAAAGKVVAFADRYHDRSHPGWAPALGVAELDKLVYVNAGFLVLPGSLGPSVLPRVRDLQRSVGTSQDWRRGGSLADPWCFPDQDTWNAVFAAELGGELIALGRELAPTPGFPGVTLHDPETLECRYPDGRQPYFLHHWKQKPWLGRADTEPNPYTMLLPRLTLAEDVMVPLSRSQVPFRLRSAVHAFAARCGYALSFRTRRRAIWVRERIRGLSVRAEG